MAVASIVRPIVRPIVGGIIRATRFSGILDQYPGAAAAYALRPLRGVFSNEGLLRGYRPSDEDEVWIRSDPSEGHISINSPLIGSSATLADFAGSGDVGVARWREQTGNYLDGVQAVAGNQPRIVIAGALQTLNGKAAMRSTTSDQQLPTGITGLTQPIAQAAVYSVTGTGTRLPFGTPPGVFTASMTIGARSVGTYMMAAPTILDGGTHPNDAAQMAFALFSGANSYGRWNGVQRAVGNAGTNVFINNLAKGPCFASESIYWPADMTAQRAEIEAAIAAHYGITLA